jgi:hypothetical protein
MKRTFAAVNSENDCKIFIAVTHTLTNSLGWNQATYIHTYNIHYILVVQLYFGGTGHMPYLACPGIAQVHGAEAILHNNRWQGQGDTANETFELMMAGRSS